MKAQIDAMADRMSSFESTVTNRMDALEGNFNALENKMGTLAVNVEPNE